MNTKFVTKNVFVSLLLGLTGMGTTVGVASGEEIDARGQKVQKYLQPVLKDNRFVDLDWNQPFSWKSENGYVHLPNEKPDHSEGVFRVYDIISTVFDADPLSADTGSAQIQNRVFNVQKTIVNPEDYKQQAWGFLKDHFSWFTVSKGELVFRTGGPLSKGIISFTWERLGKDELRIASAFITMRVTDGKIFEFGAVKRVAPWPKHKITPTQAKQKALEMLQIDKKFEDIKVTGFDLDEKDNRSFYIINVSGVQKDTDSTWVAGIEVDAMNTEAKLKYPWEPSIRGETIKPSLMVVEDRMPVWTKQGLVFVSNRQLADMPVWAVFPAQLFLQDQTEKISYLTSDLEGGPSIVSGIPGSSWIGAQMGGEDRRGWSYIFDLETGKYKVLAHPGRSGTLPAVNTSGQWAISSSKGGEPESTLDLLADNIKERNAIMPTYRGRLVMSGEQEQSIFSPDGSWLYFITSRREEAAGKSHVTYSLQRVGTEILTAKIPTDIENKQVQTIVAELPSKPQRISIFPNGERLLLQTDKGMYVVKIADKKIVPVSLQNLKDGELGVEIQDLSDGWAGPTDDRVTFAGKTTDQDGKIRQRIYSCNFDGKDLKAHTPKDNAPVAMYEFLGGKTAYELNKEVALNEIQWEDEYKKLKN